MSNAAVVTIVLSLTVLLLLATALSVLTQRLRLPFSVTLVVVGLVLGALIRSYPALQPLASVELSSDVLIYIFLPTLIFEAAFAVDSRLLTRNLLPVLFLAVPAVLVSAAITGMGIHWAIGVPLSAALVFGALITATDSTAVLAILDDQGAPKRLNILAQGENLFNDAASIVIFGLLLAVAGIDGGSLLAEDASPIVSASVTFLANFVGGILAGAVVGFAAGKLIEISDGDDRSETLLTGVVAYLSFLIAELTFGVSGIMAVVGAGLTLGGWGRTKFSPETLEHLERFWAYIAFVASSLVFLLVGLTIDPRTLGGTLGPIGWGILIAIAARAVGIMGLFPLVNRLPGVEPTSLRYQTAMVWGGLRGATALVLAMSLPESFAYRELFVTLTVGVVLFSLIVQGVTLDPLIRWLGLHRASPVEEYIRQDSLLSAKRRARESIPELRRGGVVSDVVAREVEDRYKDDEAVLRANLLDLRRGSLLDGEDEVRLIRREYLLVEKRSNRDLFRSGVLSEKAYKELQHSIELQLDRLRLGRSLPRWTIHSPAFWRLQDALFRMLDGIAPSSRLAQRYRLRRIAERYEQHWGRLISSDRVLEEIEQTVRRGHHAPEVLEPIRELYVGWHANARRRLEEIGEQFPEYATKVQRIVAVRLCLQAEGAAVRDLEDLEVLPERDAAQIRDAIERQLRRLRHQPVEELRPAPRELLAKVPLFQGLPTEEFGHIVSLLRPRTFLAGEAVVREGEEGSSLFLIGRGVVRVSTGERILATLLAGDFFGEMAVLTAQPRSATVAAITDCFLYELRRADLEEIETVYPRIRNLLEQKSRERAAALVESTLTRVAGGAS